MSDLPRCPCGNVVKTRANTYCCPACVPRALRSASGKKGRRNYAYHHRMKFFREELTRLTNAGCRLTVEDIVASFAAVYRRGYSNGYQASIVKGWKVERRTEERGPH